jgi:hypothetical protein
LLLVSGAVVGLGQEDTVPENSLAKLTVPKPSPAVQPTKPQQEQEAPQSLMAAFRAARQAEASEKYKVKQLDDGSHRALNPAKKMETEFLGGKIRVQSKEADSTPIELELSRFGREGTFVTPTKGKPVITDNKIEYQRGHGLTEWYLNGPMGVEQGFTIVEQPVGDGELVFELAVSGDVTAKLSSDGREVEFLSSDGTVVGSYGDLHVVDGEGKTIDSSLTVADGAITIVIDDIGAVYPLVVDPYIETKLIRESSGAAGDGFGSSVAISGDTAAVGAEKEKLPSIVNILVKLLAALLGIL